MVDESSSMRVQSSDTDFMEKDVVGERKRSYGRKEGAGVKR